VIPFGLAAYAVGLPWGPPLLPVISSRTPALHTPQKIAVASSAAPGSLPVLMSCGRRHRRGSDHDRWREVTMVCTLMN